MKIRDLGLCVLACLAIVGCGTAPTATPAVLTSQPEPTATAAAPAQPTDTQAPTAEPTKPPAAIKPTDTPPPAATAPAPEATPTHETAGQATPTRPTGPVFTFLPKKGGPGTTVRITGANFEPGKNVVVRLGVPEPVGEALGSAKVDSEGKWLIVTQLPGTLPSGKPVPSENVKLVVMDENNGVYASQSFAFTAASGGSGTATQGEYPKDPKGVLDAFLAVFKESPNSPDLQKYLSTFRKSSMTPGGITALLNVQGTVTAFRTEPARTGSSSDNSSVPAVLAVNGKEESRVFTLIFEDNTWRIDAVNAPGQ